MALRNIVFSDNELIRKKSKLVEKFDDNLAVLLDDMYDTMVKNRGVGIAGPQVGVLRKVFVVESNGVKMEFVNPEIVSQEGSSIEVEGCLSVKGINGYVERPIKVTIKAQTRDGDSFSYTVSGWLARIICHENDHLDGILFIDKMLEEYKPNKRKNKWKLYF